MACELRCADTRLLTFSFSTDAFGTKTVEILGIAANDVESIYRVGLGLLLNNSH